MLEANKLKFIAIRMIVFNALMILAAFLAFFVDKVIVAFIPYGFYIALPAIIFIFHVVISIVCLGYAILELSRNVIPAYRWAGIVLLTLYLLYNLLIVSFSVIDIVTRRLYHLIDHMPILPTYILCGFITSFFLLASYQLIKPKWIFNAVLAITVCLGVALWFWLYPNDGLSYQGANSGRKIVVHYIVIFFVTPVLCTPLYLLFPFQKYFLARLVQCSVTKVIHLFYWYFMGVFIILTGLFLAAIRFGFTT